MSERSLSEREKQAVTTPDATFATVLAARPYQKVIRGDEVEGFLAEAPELPGCVTAGETADEAIAILQDAIEGWIEAALVAGEPIPEPAAVRLTA